VGKMKFNVKCQYHPLLTGLPAFIQFIAAEWGEFIAHNTPIKPYKTTGKLLVIL
jgi:hypothetical protein